MKAIVRILGTCMLLLVVLLVGFYFHPLWFNDQRVHFDLWRKGVHSRYIEVNGSRMHFFEARTTGSAGTPVLLIHGLGSRSEEWAPLIPRFAAEGFQVYAPDLLGYGSSDRPDIDFSIASEEKAVLGFMQAAGIKEANVIGWSMGGWVAAKLTLDHPELVNRLVLYDSAGLYFGTFDTNSFTPSDLAGLERLSALLQPHPTKIPDFVARDALRSLQSNAWVVRRTIAAMVSGRDLLDFRLRGLRKPTLIVWGGQDTLIPLDVGESMHHLIAGSSLVVAAGCGHLAPVQCAPAIFPVTLSFLKADPPWKSVEQTLPAR